MTGSAIRIAFPLLGRGEWTGGLIYLKNTLRLIRSQLSDALEPWIFLSPEENDKHGAELAPLVDGRVIVDAAVSNAGRGSALGRTILLGADRPLAALLHASQIQVVFENAAFYGAKFDLPVVSWIPDFQHRHMPEMFGRMNWWRRDLGFRAQMGSGRTLMLSSDSAKADLYRFYKGAPEQVHTVHFAIDLDLGPHFARGDEVRKTYDLPDRFFFLPNQFWKHKNHGVVIKALARLKAAGELEAVPPIILTGQPRDPRNPAYFQSLMDEATAEGVESHFRYLGLLPYDDVLSLNAACAYMINPSRFEGWSTPIEEAKAFGTPLILSDIPIHREQAPNAVFFDPLSVDSASQALRSAAIAPPLQRPTVARLRALQDARIKEHADSLLAAVTAALEQGRKPS